MKPKQAPGGRSALTFLIAYTAMYGFSVWCATRLMDDALAPGWAHLLPHKTRLLVAMAAAIVVSGALSMLMASITVMSHAGFGSDVMTPRIFFAPGGSPFSLPMRRQ